LRYRAIKSASGAYRHTKNALLENLTYSAKHGKNEEKKKKIIEKFFVFLLLLPTRYCIIFKHETQDIREMHFLDVGFTVRRGVFSLSLTHYYAGAFLYSAGTEDESYENH
jgi:hypothetical protein